MTPLDRMKATAKKENAAMRKVCGLGMGNRKSNACPKVAARRERLAEMQRSGMTLVQIAIELNVTYSTALSDSAKVAA